MGRAGRVIGDRYHARILRTHRQARNACEYVRLNRHRHMAQVGERISKDWVDPFSSWANLFALPTPKTTRLRFVYT
jgi:hypothetical protein